MSACRRGLYCPALVLSCSVIVCTRRRPDQLDRCLASLASLDGPDPEVIVVDNTSGDPATERVTADANARYVLQRRVGLSSARNAGIDAASGKLVAFLDDDAVVDATWLSRHEEALADVSLMATTGRVVPVEKDRALDLGERPFVVDRSDPWWYERANFGGLGSGANMVFRRQAFEEGARFRETLGLGGDLEGFEDYHMWFKMIEQGARIAYVPGAVIRHGPELSADLPTRRTARDHRRAAAYLAMLLFEEPEFRSRTMRYMVQLLRGKRLPWRPGPAPSRRKMLAAGYRGTLVYLRSRMARR